MTHRSETSGGNRLRVCVGQFAGAHGVRGLVRLRSFTEHPDGVAQFGPVEDETGTRRYSFRIVGRTKETLTVQVEGIADREQAQELNGVRLFVPREKLPEPEDEDEFYHADLIGCAAVMESGEELGLVLAIHDFGGGEMLELGHKGRRSIMVPFTRVSVPVVDIRNRRVIVDPPAGLQRQGRELDAETEDGE